MREDRKGCEWCGRRQSPGRGRGAGRRSVRVAAAVGAIVVTVALTAQANPELPAMYDARSIGMGGTGVAFIDSVAAIRINPANLTGIGDYGFGGTLDIFIPKLGAPFALGPTSVVDRESDSPPVPLLFLGGAKRITDRLVVGGAVYFQSGVGAQYSDLPLIDTLSLSIYVLEASLPIAYKVNDKLSIGGSVRLGYVEQSSDLVQVDDLANPTNVMRIEQDLSGISYPGILLGVNYRPTEDISIGASYRSKLVTKLSGGVVMRPFGSDDESSLSAGGKYATPHTLRLGMSYSALQARLLVAVEATAQFYSDSNGVMEQDIEGMDTTQQLDWRDSYGARIGVEGWVSKWLAVRGGYAMARSATPETRPNPFTPPPGNLYAPMAGVGVRLDKNLELGVAGYYAWGVKEVATTVDPVTSAPGDYETTAWFAGVTASYSR